MNTDKHIMSNNVILSNKELVNALYWKLHYHYLLNERNLANRYAEMIDDEIKKHGNCLLDELGYKHYGRYLDMRANMRKNIFSRLCSNGIELIEKNRHNDESIKKEKVFCKEILKNLQYIISILGISDKYNVVPEFDMGIYGRCDFLIRDLKNRTWIVIEVKMGAAPTSVISQIDRYRLALELDMCLGLHDEVKAYVMAEQFTEYVSRELSRAGVGMILHKGDITELNIISNDIDFDDILGIKK